MYVYFMELYIVEYIVMYIYIYSVYIRYKLLVCHMDFHRKSSTFIFLLSNAYFPELFYTFLLLPSLFFMSPSIILPII